jgi:outer membrane protein assembly factor BamA
VKKQILIVLITLLVGFNAMAQTNREKRVENNVKAYVDRVEGNIKLTDEEKTKLYELKKEHTIGFWKLRDDLKDKPELKEERVKLNKEFSEKIVKEFARIRGVEILKASRVKKEE